MRLPPHPGRLWQLAGRDPNRCLRNAQAQQAAIAPQSPPPPRTPESPCVWTRTGSGQRSLEHRNGSLSRSGHLPVHPFASSHPAWAGEDIKVAKGNIVSCGSGASKRDPPPCPPPLASPGGATQASATQSAVRGSRPGAVQVVATATRAHALPPPIQPMAAALWALLPWTTALQLHRRCQGESRDTIWEWNIIQITPGRHPAEWKQPS